VRHGGVLQPPAPTGAERGARGRVVQPGAGRSGRALSWRPRAVAGSTSGKLTPYAWEALLGSGFTKLLFSRVPAPGLVSRYVRLRQTHLVGTPVAQASCLPPACRAELGAGRYRGLPTRWA
jgi:hypothetical protein